MNKFSSRLTVLLLTVVLTISLAAAGCTKTGQPNPPTGQPPTTPGPTPTPTPGPTTVSAAATDGGKLYYSYACVYCHGVGGKGGVPNPFNEGGDATIPPLTGADFQKEYSADQAVTAMLKDGSVLNNGKATSMPAWNGILNDQQMTNLIAYIRAGLPDTGNQLAVTKAGPDVYSAYACDKCHGQIGKGGVANVAATDPDDKTIPTLGTAKFRGEFNTTDKIRKVINQGSIIEGGKAGVVFMPRWGDVMTAVQSDIETNWLLNYK